MGTLSVATNLFLLIKEFLRISMNCYKLLGFVRFPGLFVESLSDTGLYLSESCRSRPSPSGFSLAALASAAANSCRLGGWLRLGLGWLGLALGLGLGFARPALGKTFCNF